MTVKNYVLDINKTSLQHPSIVLRQDDYNIYTVNISVTDNGIPVDLGSYTLNFLGITPAGAKIIDSENFITTAGDLAVGKFSYRFPKEASGSKGVYDVAYFRLKTTSGATSTIDLNLRVLGGIDLTADEVKDYITVDDTLRNTLISEVFKKVDAKVDEHLATVVKGDKGDKGDPGKDGYMPIIGGRNLILGTSEKVVQATNWNMQVADIKHDESLGRNLYASVLINNAGHASDLIRGSSYIIIESIDKSGNILKSIGGNSVLYNADGISQCSISMDDNTTSVRVRIRTNNMMENTYYSRLKVERGNIPTEWTPAPEDVDSAIAKAPKLNGNNMYVGDNTYMGTNTFMDGISLNGKNKVNNLTDTDWLDIPLVEGRTGIAKYKVSMGKIFIHLDSIRGMSGTGLSNPNSYIGKIPKGGTYYTRNSAVLGNTVVIISCSPDGQIYIVDTAGEAPKTTDVLHTDFVVM